MERLSTLKYACKLEIQSMFSFLNPNTVAIGWTWSISPAIRMLWVTVPFGKK